MILRSVVDIAGIGDSVYVPTSLSGDLRTANKHFSELISVQTNVATTMGSLGIRVRMIAIVFPHYPTRRDHFKRHHGPSPDNYDKPTGCTDDAKEFLVNGTAYITNSAIPP